MINNNLKLHLRLDSIAVADSSGNSHQGVASGTLSIDTTDNTFAACIDFNGTDSSVTVADHVDLQITVDQTISLWLWPDSFSQQQNPYAKAYGGEGSLRSLGASFKL